MEEFIVQRFLVGTAICTKRKSIRARSYLPISELKRRYEINSLAIETNKAALAARTGRKKTRRPGNYSERGSAS